MKDSIPRQSLTYTKLHRPRVSRELVPRPDLLKRLNVQQELALLLAPAGYGKTTLLSTWLDTCGRPSAWLSLDENDNDLGVFTTYVATAVQKIFPTACTETLTLLNGITSPPSPVVARSLLNDLNAIPQEFILVLDDYHVIHEHSIHDLMTEVLRHPPRTLYLVLSARQDPPLPLASLRARGQVMQLRAADLRFSLKEAALLLQDVMKLAVDDRIVAFLETKTEGWPAGLRLAGLSLLHKDGPKAIETDLDGYNRYVVDYLLTEVLSQLPMSVQEFLIKTSILDQLCGPLCEAVTGMHDRMFSGQTYLEWLERADLFILSLDAEQHWYRYHHLFQQLLAHQLEQQFGPAEISALHAAASAWFAQHGFVEEALHHALVAGDMPAAVQIVAQQRHELMNQEQSNRLERWLHQFPRRVIDEQPDLLLSEVSIKLLRHQLAEVPPILDRVEALIPHMALEPAAADHLQGEVEARRSTEYFFDGDGTRSMVAAQRALEKLPTEWWDLRLRARLFLSAGYLMTGDLSQAYATLYDSGEPDHGRTFQMRLLAAACFTHWMAGDLSDMAHAAKEVQAWDEKLQHVESTTWSRYHLGLNYYQRNDLAEAEKCLTPIVLQPYVVHVMCFLNSAVLLALINQARGRPEKAHEIAAVMLSFALETRSTGMLSAAQAFQAELALRQGRLAEASQWARHYQFPALTPTPFFYAPPMTLARILLAQDTPDSRKQAAQILSQLHDYASSIHHTWSLIEGLALQAMLHDADGDDECSLETLQQAIGLAEPGGFIRVFADLGPQIDPLLAELAQRDVAPMYIAEIRSALNDKDISYETARPETNVPASALKSSPILAEMLTNREMDVLLLLAQRLTNKEIAQILGVSANTVKQHTSTLFQKLQVNDRRQAVAWARRNGLLPPI